MEQRTNVQRRTQNDLPKEVLGSVYWTEELGYQVIVPTKEGTNKVIDVEFINDDWYLLVETPNGYETDKSGRFKENQFGVGTWPDDHPNNPKNYILATAPSFGDFLLQKGTMTSQDDGVPSTQINMGGGPIPKKKNGTDDENRGGLRGRAPEMFDGDRTKTKTFITELKVYF